MLKEKLGVDNKDIKIISMFIDNPEVSQNEIAEKLQLSQPSINVRVQKLRKRGILNTDVGISFNKTSLFLSRVDFTANNANTILEELKKCPFFVNGFVMSGKNNVSIFLVNEDLRKIDEVINKHVRNNDQISDINVNMVVSTSHDFLFKLNLNKETDEKQKCDDPSSCKSCEFLDTHIKR